MKAKIFAVALIVFLSALSQNVLGNGDDVRQQLLQVYDETQVAQVDRLAETMRVACTKDRNTRAVLYRSVLKKNGRPDQRFVVPFIGDRADPMPHVSPEFRAALQWGIAQSGEQIVPGEDRIAWYVPKTVFCSI